MNFLLRIPLQTSEEQAARLLALQVAFAQACNVLSPTVRESRCWNRVALHHMAYRALREQFPALGSQMVCNVIYSVCRASRLVYQHPASPFFVGKWGDRLLPLLRFQDDCPVYFDRHTLSLKDGLLSMYTLDGRIRFQLTLRDDDAALFREKRLREIVLVRRVSGEFELSFGFSDQSAVSDDEPALSTEVDWPEYLKVEAQA